MLKNTSTGAYLSPFNFDLSSLSEFLKVSSRCRPRNVRIFFVTRHSLFPCMSSVRCNMGHYGLHRVHTNCKSSICCKNETFRNHRLLFNFRFGFPGTLSFSMCEIIASSSAPVSVFRERVPSQCMHTNNNFSYLRIPFGPKKT